MTGSTRKTPAQRAEEALGVARRAAEKASDKLVKLRAGIKAAEDEAVSTRNRLDYLAADPDLSEESRKDARAWLEEVRLESAPVDVQPVGAPAPRGQLD